MISVFFFSHFLFISTCLVLYRSFEYLRHDESPRKRPGNENQASLALNNREPHRWALNGFDWSTDKPLEEDRSSFNAHGPKPLTVHGSSSNVLTYPHEAKVEAEWTVGMLASLLLSDYLTYALLSLKLPFEAREGANDTKMD